MGGCERKVLESLLPSEDVLPMYDADKVTAALVSVCESSFSGPGQVLAVRQITEGWECEVWSFDYKSRNRPRPHSLILRLYFGSGATEKVSAEAAMMEAVRAAGFPVPTVFVWKPDQAAFGRPFMIMERVDGPLLGDQLRKAQGLETNSLFDIFCRLAASLHQLEIPDEGPATLQTRTIDDWLREGRRILGGLDMNELNLLLDWLERNRPAAARLSLTHNDFHPWNVLMHPTKGPLVIDWTSGGITDLRFDLAWTLLLTATSLGEEARHVVLEGYERHAAAEVKDLQWFEAAACGRRLADILMSLSAGPESMGMRPGAADQMLKRPATIETPARMLVERTGIHIPVAEYLSQLSE